MWEYSIVKLEKIKLCYILRGLTGRSAVWLARQTGGLKAASSNLAVPTILYLQYWFYAPRHLSQSLKTASSPSFFKSFLT